MLSLIIDKALGFWDYCVENKKQSIVTLVILALAFFVFGYFSILIVAKILGFVFGIVLSVISMYFSNLLITLPLTIAGVWYYKSRS